MKKVLNISELNNYYNIGTLVSIVGLITFVFGFVIGIIPAMDDFGSFLSNIGSNILTVGALFVAVPKIMNEKIASGICLALFGGLTLGIWPIIAASSDKKKLAILQSEGINSIEVEVKKESLISGYNAGMIVAIVALSTLIIGIGFFVALVPGIIVSIQLIREKRIVHGICMYLFGFFSLGIWPLVIAIKSKKRLNVDIEATSNDENNPQDDNANSPQDVNTYMESKNSIVTPIYLNEQENSETSNPLYQTDIETVVKDDDLNSVEAEIIDVESELVDESDLAEKIDEEVIESEKIDVQVVESQNIEPNSLDSTNEEVKA